jgi:hypothetical protein
MCNVAERGCLHRNVGEHVRYSVNLCRSFSSISWTGVKDASEPHHILSDRFWPEP